MKLIGLILRAVLLIAGLYVLTGPHQSRTPSVAVQYGTWCPEGGCVTIADWETLASPELRLPLALAFTYNPQWRLVAWTATARGTTLRVGSLEKLNTPRGRVLGAYNALSNSIIIDQSVLEAPIEVQAAILSHEMAHAASLSVASSLGGQFMAADCLQEEARAAAWELSTYISVPHTGSGSLWNASEDLLVGYWKANRLSERIMLTPGYQRECLGRELAAP